MPMLVCGITLADMKFRKASPTPIRSRRIMQNYDIIWLVWIVSRVVSRVARMLSTVPFDCSPSLTTADNSTDNAIPTIRLMSWTSLAHYISHSLRRVIRQLQGCTGAPSHAFFRDGQADWRIILLN